MTRRAAQAARLGRRGRDRGRGESGLTLVELMITVVILGVVIAGALNMGYSLMNGFRYTRTAATVERSARASLAIVADAIKQASPGVSNGDIIDLSAASASDCEIYNGAGNNSALTITPGDATDPDELTVIHASGGLITSLAAGTNLSSDPSSYNYLPVNDASGFRAGDYALVLANNFQQGLLFKIDAVDVSSSPNTLSLAGGDTVDNLCGNAFTNAIAGQYDSTAPTLNVVIRAKKSRFYVDTASYGGVPVLVLDTDGAGPENGEPIAPGIEELQIVAKIDGIAGTADVDGVVDAAGVRHDSTGEIVAPNEIIRSLVVSVIGRSLKPVSNGDVSNRPALGDRGAGAADGFLRRIHSTEVEIRNFEGSPGTRL